jgi:hypothetical protein
MQRPASALRRLQAICVRMPFQSPLIFTVRASCYFFLPVMMRQQSMNIMIRMIVGMPINIQKLKVGRPIIMMPPESIF